MSEDRQEPAGRTPLQFAARRAAPAQVEAVGEPWVVLIADDDDEVHNVTRMLLKDVTFDSRSLEFVSARSAAETREMMACRQDVAVLLLDVVMETEHAGLDLVRYIRQTLNNPQVRIILRTGQPGYAPERQVVEQFDINDYREKTELTAQKLYTAVISALRAYRDIRNLDASRRGLEQIIGATAGLFEQQSLQRFASGVLTQLTALLDLSYSSLFLKQAARGAPLPAGSGTLVLPGSHAGGLAAVRRAEDFQIIASNGCYAACDGSALRQAVAPHILQRLMEAVAQRCSLVGRRDFVGYYRTTTGAEHLVYVETRQPFDDVAMRLLRVFSANIGIAFDNVSLNNEIAETQREIIQTLSGVVETRSVETSLHTLRVGRGAALLAEKMGLPEAEVEFLRTVAPMHDLGKVGVPDAILNKPGALTPEEYTIVRTHTTVGYNILKSSRRRILQTAAVVCLQHHEHWDGSGYPQGLKGEEIDRRARITGLIDVFDAISHDRPYKKGWPLADVEAYIRKGRERQFDPALADLFLKHFDEFAALREPVAEDPGVARRDAEAEAGAGGAA